MEPDAVAVAQTWRTTHGDMTGEEWELIADLVSPYWTPGSMGRPVKVDRRRVVDAIFYVVATGCQWRALPDSYPNWNTVHRYHLEWSSDGTWERIAERLAAAGDRNGSVRLQKRGNSLAELANANFDCGHGHALLGQVPSVLLCVHTRQSPNYNVAFACATKANVTTVWG